MVPNGVGTGKAAGKILAAAHGVAIVAIADRREIAAALDQRVVERLRRGRIDRGYRRPPHDGERRNRSRDHGNCNDPPDNPRRCHCFAPAVEPP